MTSRYPKAQDDHRRGHLQLNRISNDPDACFLPSAASEPLSKGPSRSTKPKDRSSHTNPLNTGYKSESCDWHAGFFVQVSSNTCFCEPQALQFTSLIKTARESKLERTGTVKHP